MKASFYLNGYLPGGAIKRCRQHWAHRTQRIKRGKRETLKDEEDAHHQNNLCSI